MVLFISIYWARIPFDLFLGEPVATFLCIGSFLTLLGFAGHRKFWYLPISGLLFGLAIGVRPNLLPFTIPVLIWLYVINGNFKTSLQQGLSFLIPIAIIIALVTARNYFVSGKLVPFSTNGPVTFLVGNPIPPGIKIRAVQRPFLDSLSLAPETRQVLEFMLQAPGAFFNGILGKFLYLFGVEYPSFRILQIGVFLPSVSAIVGAILSLIGDGDGKLRLHRLLAITFILCNMLVTSVIIVNVYGWRYILPLFPFIYIFASYPVVALIRHLSFGRLRCDVD